MSPTTGKIKDTVNDAVDQASEKVSEISQAASKKLDRNREKVTRMANEATDYVKDHNANEMMSDFERVVRNNPAPALIIAGVVGFFIGRAMSSND